MGAGGADPFTGGGRYVPPAAAMDTAPAPAPAPAAQTGPRYFPQDEFVFFDKGNVEGMTSEWKGVWWGGFV